MTNDLYWKSRMLTEQSRLVEALGGAEKFVTVSQFADDDGYELSYQALAQIYESLRWWLIDNRDATAVQTGAKMTELINEYGERE